MTETVIDAASGAGPVENTAESHADSHSVTAQLGADIALAAAGADHSQGAVNKGASGSDVHDDAGSGTEVNGDAAAAAGDKSAIEYQDFTVPEGVSLNPELLTEFKDIAKGMGLQQEQAQVLTDLGVKLTQNLLAQQQAQFEATKADWLAQVKADKEIGGDKLQANLAIAAKALDAFATPELKALFDYTGLGNHPHMIKAFIKAGQLISEDSLVPGGTQPVGAGKSAANTLYPNQA